jgi:hypothetical protein
MYAITKRSSHRTISLLLTACMVALLLLPANTTSADQAETKTILVFPVLDESESGIEGTDYRATSALHMAIDAQTGFAATKFSAHSPLVRRAIGEGLLRQVDVEAGEMADAELALFLGGVLEFDYVVIANLKSLDIQDEPRQVKAVLSGQAYRVKGNVDEATGDVVDPDELTVFKAFGVTGTSSTFAHYTGSDRPLISEAIKAAASQAARTLAGEPAGQQPVAKRPKTQAWKWLLYAVAVGVLVIGISNSSSADPGPGPAEQAKPITNLSLQPLQTNMQLMWNPPTGTTLQILRYEISRQVDGSGGFSILPSNVGPGETGYTDTNTLDGRHAYQYRVRVLYTSGDASAYTYSGALWFTR